MFFLFLLQITWKCPECNQKGAGLTAKTNHHQSHVTDICMRFDNKMRKKETLLESNPTEKAAIFEDINDVVKVTIDRIKGCRM